jgi:hypothetical protein
MKVSLSKGRTWTAVAAASLGLALTASIAAADVLPTRSTHSIAGNGQWTLVTESRNPDGSVTDVWRDANGSVITATGAPGLQVTASGEIATKGAGLAVDYQAGVGIAGATGIKNSVR